MPKNIVAEVKADAADFISTMTAAAERTDELGDKAASAARSVDRLGEDATETAGRVSALAGANSTAASTSAAFSATMWGSLIPAVGALSTVLVPLTATLGAVATATAGVAAGFGAVVSTGVFAYGERLAAQNEKRLAQINEKIAKLNELKNTEEGLTDAQQEQLAALQKQREEVKKTTSVMGALSAELEPVREQLRETALSLGEAFIPLIADAIDALPAFIKEIEAAIGSLEPFADALRDAGRVAFRVIPRIVSQIMDMGRNALPAVRRLGRAIADNAVPALKAMDRTAARVLSILPSLDSETAAAASTLNEFGINILKTVIPPLERVFAVAVDTASAFNDLDDRTQQLTASATLAAPAIAAIAAKLARVSPALGVATAAVGAFAFAWKEDIRGVRSETNAFVEDATGFETVGALLRETAREIADAATTAIDDLKSWADETAAVQTTLNDFERALADASTSVLALANGEWERGFESLENSVAAFDDGLKRALVGSGGSGGLTATLDTGITRAARWLKNEGPTIITEGVDALLDSIVDRLSTLTTVMIGPDGKSGFLSTMVDEAVFYLQHTVPPLIGGAAEAIGEAIRGTLLDLTAPLLKGRDSEFWDTFADVATWIIENAPHLMAGVGNALVKAILAGILGLYNGLVGDEGDLRTPLRNAGKWLRNNARSVLGDVGGAIVDAIIDTITGLYRGLVGNSALRTPIANAGEWLINNVGSVLGDIGGAIVDAILSGVTGLQSAIQSRINNALAAVNVDGGGGGGGEDGDEGLTELEQRKRECLANGGTWSPHEEACRYPPTETETGEDPPNNTTSPPVAGDGTCPDGYYFHPVKKTCEPVPGGGGPQSGDATAGDDVGGLASGGLVEESGLAMLHGPELVLSQEETRQAQESGVAVGDVAVADDVRSGVSGVERKLDAIHRALRDELDVTVDVQDADRYRASRR